MDEGKEGGREGRREGMFAFGSVITEHTFAFCSISNRQPRLNSSYTTAGCCRDLKSFSRNIT